VTRVYTISSPPIFKLEQNSPTATKGFRPIEDLIAARNLKPFHEQLLTNITNLSTAYGVSDLADAFKVSPWLSLPLSFVTMHLTNKGTRNLDKLGYTSLAGLGALALQKAFRLPKWLLKTLVSAVIFSINNKKLSLPVNLLNGKLFKLSKDDWQFVLKKFLKIETVIHSIPNIIHPLVNHAQRRLVTENKSLTRYPIALGLFISKILGLSGGFVLLGNWMHKLLKLGGAKDGESLTEMLIGACPAELASSTKAILLPEG